jgi:hypothetical protein
MIKQEESGSFSGRRGEEGIEREGGVATQTMSVRKGWKR